MSGSRGRRLAVFLGNGLVLVGLALAGSAAATGASAATAPSGQAYVVDALDAVTADVLVDGRTVATAVAPKSIIGPLSLSAGEHAIVLRQGSTAVVTARFTVIGGQSIDVVAHRTADASPTAVVTVFGNDLSPVAPGKSRLVVSHVAVAPPADIRVDGKPLFRNVANGESLSLVVPAKTYSVDVVPTATSGPVILAPVRLTITGGMLTRVFAIGDPAQNSTDAIVQTLPVPVVGASRPRSVHTGDGGQTADSFTADSFTGRSPLLPWAVVLLVVGLVSSAGPSAARRAGHGLGPLARSRHAR